MLLINKRKNWCQMNSIIGQELALHTAESGLISSTPCGPLSTKPGMIPEKFLSAKLGATP